MILHEVHTMNSHGPRDEGPFQQIECGLAWCIVLSTTIRVITVVKMLWTHEAQPSESATNFDHCDDVYRCRFNKLTSVFYASVLLLIMNFVITLSK